MTVAEKKGIGEENEANRAGKRTFGGWSYRVQNLTTSADDFSESTPPVQNKNQLFHRQETSESLIHIILPPL